MKARVCFILFFMFALLALTPETMRAAPSILPAGFTRTELGAGLNGPTAIAFVGKKFWVTEKGGAIRVIRPNGKLRTSPLLTLDVDTDAERGLTGLALDPKYNTNEYFYVYYTTGPGAKRYSGTPENRVSRLKKRLDKDGFREKILLDHIPSTYGIHNGGDIHFGFDGKLYISVGDSGCCPNDAQGLDTLRGKVLRINSNGTIPDDNPFFNTIGARQEIWAYGFRNPWRFTTRASNHSYVIADVGESTWEEVDSLKAGKNYGWPTFEGPCPFSNLACDPNTVDYGGTQKPIHWYNHSSGTETGMAIAGGVFAENNTNYPAPYADSYFYGDPDLGWVHFLTMDNKNRVTAQHEFDQVSSPVAFGIGPDGNIYVVDHAGGVAGNGVIHKYTYASP